LRDGSEHGLRPCNEHEGKNVQDHGCGEKSCERTVEINHKPYSSDLRKREQTVICIRDGA
jgi:hypothetical protein